MPTLTVRHLDPDPSRPATALPLFQVADADGNVTEPVAVPPAAGYPVEGRPNDDLMSELRWYLERFLDGSS